MSTATVPVQASPSLRPSGTAALSATGGLALFGACAGLGVGALAEVPQLALAALLVPSASWTVTGLSLMVAHQFLDLDAPPEAIGGALVGGFVRSGRLAAGFSPVMLFFSSTSPSWFLLGCGLLGLVAFCGLPTTAGLLLATEPGSERMDFVLLVRAWLVFTTLVALRIGADLLT